MNYMVETIEQIYNNGGFDCIYKNTKMEYRINDNGEIVIKYFKNINKRNDYEIINNERTVRLFLTSIFINSIFKFNDEWIIEPIYQSDESKRHNNKITTYLANYYLVLLADNREVIRKIIERENNEELVDIIFNAYGKVKIPEASISLSLLCACLVQQYLIFEEVLQRGQSIYEELETLKKGIIVDKSITKSISELEKEWKDFCTGKDILVAENSTTNITRSFISKTEYKDNHKIEDIDLSKILIMPENTEEEHTIDTTILDDENIAYEFIDDRVFKVNPAVGREKEIRLLGAILSSPSYSAILIGEPGVGKTAVIEGLAYAIQNGLVSDNLKNKKILKINISNIVSDTRFIGTFEKKMEIIIGFLKENPDCYLYLDELHTASGAGAHSKSDTDMLDILKPHVENGHIKMIGATTSKEYDEYIKQDSAFASRLKNIKINELSFSVLKEVIESNIKKFEEEKNIKFASSNDISDGIIDILIELTQIKHQVWHDKRYNPRFILSLIDLAFGFACYDGADYVGVNYICESIEMETNLNESAKKNAIEELKALDKDGKRYSNIISFKKYVKKLNR